MSAEHGTDGGDTVDAEALLAELAAADENGNGDGSGDEAYVPALDMTDARSVRALTELLVVVERDPGLYRVYSETGAEYVVDAETASCTCRDAEYRDPDGGCKHVRRVALWRGDRRPPACLDLEGADDLLVERLEQLGGRA